MVNDLKLFTHLRKWPVNAATNHVLLADGSTRTKISGVGTVKFSLPNSTVIEMENILYVPSLSSSLFSVRQHIAYNNCKMRSEGNTLRLIFPNFTIDTAPDNFSFPISKTTSEPHYTSVRRPHNIQATCNNVTLPRRSPRLSNNLQPTPRNIQNEPLNIIQKHPTRNSVHNSTRESTSLKYNLRRPTTPSKGRPNNLLVPTPTETQNLQNEPPSSIPKNFDTSRTPHPTTFQEFSKIHRRNPTQSSV